MGTHLSNMFSELFMSSSPAIPFSVHQLFQPYITDQENDHLRSIIEEMKILQVINSMHPTKAPGPDGLPAILYQHYWNGVKQAVVTEVQNFFLEGCMPRGLNRTYVVVIPKCQNASTFQNLCPISLRNVIYEIISKLLANRLSSLLEKIISPNQAAFVPGRWIEENTVIMNEVMQTLRHKTGKGVLLAVKGDMQKAYDRVERKVICTLLKWMGFPDQFVFLV